MPEQRNDADIFDRSFKKIMGGISSRALVRFINGLFGSNHPLDSELAPEALALGVCYKPLRGLLNACLQAIS